MKRSVSPRAPAAAFSRCAVALSMAVAAFGSAAESADSAAPGVNPKDNLTKSELFYQRDRLDHGVTSEGLAVKFDRAFDAAWGGNVELPLVRVRVAGQDHSGLGDVVVRARHVRSSGDWSTILGGEVVLPTAARDELGRGKYQLNPAGGLVCAFGANSFVYAGYKHFLSVGGDADRADISDMQPRVLLARVWMSGQWALADLKYTRQLKGDRRETTDFDVEFGSMLARDVGAWVRVGTSGMDSARDWGVLLGLRKLW